MARKLLLADDGSESSLRATEEAIRLARAIGGTTAVLLKVEPEPVDWQTHGIEQEAILAHLRARAAETCEPSRRLLAEAGVPHEVRAEFGEPAPTIVRVAQEQGCDLIVMGTHGRSAIAGLVLGSVAQQVVHLATMPILLVK